MRVFNPAFPLPHKTRALAATMGMVFLLSVQAVQADPYGPGDTRDRNFAPVVFDVVLPIVFIGTIIALMVSHPAHRVVPVRYVVVRRPPPVVVVHRAEAAPSVPVPSTPAPKVQFADTQTVMVHNSNGSKIPVVLKLKNGVWTGPRGEEYDAFPTEAQLHSAYGF